MLEQHILATLIILYTYLWVFQDIFLEAFNFEADKDFFKNLW